MANQTPAEACGLPHIEPDVFDGNPRHYIQWITEFKTLIESKVSDQHLRLLYLKKYTKGNARKAIDGFLYVSQPSSYDKAQEQLKKRFGNPKSIHHEIRSRVELWEPMNDDARSLESDQKFREFSDLLDAVLMLKNEVPRLSGETHVWDIPLLIHNTILTKLPSRVVKDWRERVQSKRPEEYFPTLCDCVREAADARFNYAYSYPSSPIYHDPNVYEQRPDKAEQGTCTGVL